MIKYTWILPLVLLAGLVAGCEPGDWKELQQQLTTPEVMETVLAAPTQSQPPPQPPPPPTIDRSVFDFLTPTPWFYSPLPTPTPTPWR